MNGQNLNTTRTGRVEEPPVVGLLQSVAQQRRDTGVVYPRRILFDARNTFGIHFGGQTELLERVVGGPQYVEAPLYRILENVRGARSADDLFCPIKRTLLYQGIVEAVYETGDRDGSGTMS